MTLQVVAHVDKTVVRITGVKVRGLNAPQLEECLTQTIGRPVRLIGVTGESVDMDVYGLPESAVMRDRKGIVTALAAADGIEPDDVITIATSGRAEEVGIDDIPRGPNRGCAGQRWRRRT